LLEGPDTDEVLALTRIRARSLSDGKIGWITVMGNQGTPFLEPCPKPSYAITSPQTLQETFTSESSKNIRTLRLHEVLEVIEGPRKELTTNAVRAKCKAIKDDAIGWFTVKTRQGQVNADPGKSCYTCTNTIALTDELNIKTCKVLRKLERGEVLVVLEGPTEDAISGVFRIRCQVTKDMSEGWVTTSGNAGTVFAEESGCHYMISRAVPLQSGFQSDTVSTMTTRMLDKDEEVVLIEGPKEEKCDPVVRVHVRAVLDGAVGWVTLKPNNLMRWSPLYRCVNGTVIQNLLEVGKAHTLRRLDLDETVEVLEGPLEDASAGILRLKGRAERDGAIGWITVAGNDGKTLLACVSKK